MLKQMKYEDISGKQCHRMAEAGAVSSVDKPVNGVRGVRLGVPPRRKTASHILGS